MSRSVLTSVFIAIALLTVVAFAVHWHLDLNQALEKLQHAPPGYMALVVLVAPLLGVPLSPLLITLAVMFPFWIALGITTVVILLHHLLVLVLSYSSMAGSLKEKMQKKQLLPPSRQASSLVDNALFIFATTWIPGISYIFKPIYIALSGVDRKLYFGLGTLSQVLAALPYLLLGKIAGDGAFFWFGVALFAVFGTAWLIKRRRCARRLFTNTEFKE